MRYINKNDYGYDYSVYLKVQGNLVWKTEGIQSGQRKKRSAANGHSIFRYYYPLGIWIDVRELQLRYGELDESA